MNFSREVILDDDFHSELFSNSKYLYSESSEFSDSVDLRMVSSVTYDGLIFPTSSLGYITQEQTLSPSTILRRSDEILPELNSLTSTNENVIDKLKSSLQTLSLEILYNTDTMDMLDSSRDLTSRMKRPQLELSEIMSNPNGFQLTSSSFDYHTSEANMGSSNIQRSVENSIKPSVHILQSDLPTSVLPSNGTRSINLMHTDNNDRALDSSYLQSSFSKSNMETSIFVDSFGNTNKQTREFQTSDGFTTTSLFTNFPKSSDFRSHEELPALRDTSVDKVGSSSTVNISSSDVNSRLSNDTALSVPGTPDGFISTLLNFTTTIEAFTTNDTMTTLFEETTPIMVDIPVGSEGTTPIAEKPGVTPPKLKELEINLEGFIIPAVIAGVFLINLLGVILALAHRRKRRLKSEKSPSVRTTIVSDEDLEANSFRIPRPNILFPPYYVKENWGTWTSSHFNIYESSLFAQIDNIYDEIGKSRTSSNIHSTTKMAFLSLKDNSNGVDYYERSKASYKNLFRVIPNAALRNQEGYYLIRHNTTVEECARFCHISHTQTCMSFSYAKGLGVCALSNLFWVNGGKNNVSLLSTSVYDHYQYYTDYNPHAIASPKFPYLSVTNIDCHVTLEAHKGERISVTIPTFFASENICQDGDDGLTIYDGPDESASVIRHLCEKNFRQMVTLNSTSNYMYIRFKTKSKAIAFKALYDYKPEGYNSCLNNYCVNGATCVNDSSSSYTCACVPGFSGRFCESNIDDCISKPCYFGGSCIDEVNDFHCDCPKLFTGKRCEKYLGRCAENPCQHGDCQVKGKDDYMCQCDSGYTGKNCSIRIPSCLSSPCVQGRCIDLSQGGFFCQCPPNYNGTRCENLVSNPCAHQPCANGKCVVKGTNFLCQCNQGFTGTLCNTVKDHCLNANCYHGTCINGVGGYRCFCNSNYTGSNCNIKLNACVDESCGHGTCQLVSSGFVCLCDAGFTGERCNMTVPDYCKAAPCVHGNCTNKIYGYSCTCYPGYLGTNCDTTQNYCQGQDCGYGICENSQLGYRCLCAQGYEGVHCNKHVLTSTQPPVCNSQPCQNGGTCLSDGQSFTCKCAPPFGGTFCQNDFTPCLSSPCYGNSTCAPLAKSFVCICPPGMTGDRCEVSNACSSNPCKLGMCLNKNDSFV
ncbi:hypothetical protein FSP39_010625 [Pinctada imbricata]|uniref:Delta-like protein n=1 Tax=Pinctada imbricata TaxID=66713 RepID=A0AA88Y375_PINIB|nr:hypothetical protein FSP39_010625 [Pinctada imbricata]